MQSTNHGQRPVIWLAEDRTQETVVVAGHPYAGYTRMIAAGFAMDGVVPICLEWKIPDRTPFDHLRAHFSRRHASEFNKRLTALCANSLEETVLANKPDYVLVIDGNEITKRTRDFCTDNGIVLAMWAYDSVCNFPWIAKAAVHFDLAFTHEPEDVQTLSVNGPAKYLPLAFDPTVYFPIPDTGTREVDVFFAGAIRGNYSERTRALREIGRNLPDLRLRVFSPEMPLYSTFWIQDFLIDTAGNDSRVIRGRAGHREINEMYNRSRICVNIHNKQSQKAVSPRTFEVLGSGGLLVTDREAAISDELRAGLDYVFYSDEKEMLDMIRRYVTDEESSRAIAISGHTKALRNHTYRRRADTILQAMRARANNP